MSNSTRTQLRIINCQEMTQERQQRVEKWIGSALTSRSYVVWIVILIGIDPIVLKVRKTNGCKLVTVPCGLVGGEGLAVAHVLVVVVVSSVVPVPPATARVESCVTVQHRLQQGIC